MWHWKKGKMVISMAAMLVLCVSCANRGACKLEQPYYNANESAPLVAPTGMSLPETDPRYVIPDPSQGEPVKYATPVKKESRRSRSVYCLDEPPPLTSGS